MKKSPADTPEPDAEERQGHLSFGLFQREQRSLFGEILDWMLTPLLLLWPLSLALTWFVAQGIASKPFDRALEFNLQALTQFVVLKGDQVQFNLTAQARDLLLEVRKSDLRGPSSPYISYLLAICHDCLEDFAMAATCVEEALRTDPLSVPFNRSFEIVSQRIRKALAAPGRDLDDPSTPRLYEILVKSGEADTESHLAMSRYCLQTGDPAKALRLARALTVLDPTCRRAWTVALEAAKATQDSVAVEEMEAGLAHWAQEEGPVVFPIPGKAEG